MPPRHKSSTPASSNQQRPGPPSKYPSVGRQASTYNPNSNNPTSFTLPHNSAYSGDSSLDNLYHSDASPHNQGLAASPGVPSSHSHFPHSPSALPPHPTETLPPHPTETPPRNPQRSFDALLGTFQPNFDTWRRQDSKYVPTNSNPNPRKNPKGFLYDNGAGTGRLPKSDLLSRPRDSASTAPPSSKSPPSSHLSNPFPPIDPLLVLPSQPYVEVGEQAHHGEDSEEEVEEEDLDAHSGRQLRPRKEYVPEPRSPVRTARTYARRARKAKHRQLLEAQPHLSGEDKKRFERFQRRKVPMDLSKKETISLIKEWRKELAGLEAYGRNGGSDLFAQNVEDLKSDIEYMSKRVKSMEEEEHEE
ncbi:hypothetical protein JCM5350_008337 [Sporobolomyces pararoseus]